MGEYCAGAGGVVILYLQFYAKSLLNFFCYNPVKDRMHKLQSLETLKSGLGVFHKRNYIVSPPFEYYKPKVLAIALAIQRVLLRNNQPLF